MEAQDLHISGEHFTVEDLLDFPIEDDIVMNDAAFFANNSNTNNSNDSTISTTSSASGNENHFSNNFASRSFSVANFSGELCVPYDDVADLEWLSHFVEDSFSSSSSNLQSLHFIPEPKLPNSVQAQPEHQSSLPAKAQRSKRSRAPPCDWSSRLLMLNPLAETSSCTSSELNSGKTTSSYRKNENTNYHEGRKCLHCGSEKTPQWRTGPMGPKTLCNACGVRFKSGRLVPEYRPAASPTFVSAKHSNSHRKVLELRRQKEMMIQRNQPFVVGQSQMFNVSDGGDYMMRHGGGIDYGHVM